MKSVLNRVWTRIRALFARLKKTVQHGTTPTRPIRPRVSAEAGRLARPARATALLLAGVVCTISLSAVSIPAGSVHPASAAKAESAEEPEDPDLPGPELSGTSPFRFSLTLSLDNDVSVLSRGLAVEEQRYAERNAIGREPSAAPAAVPAVIQPLSYVLTEQSAYVPEEEDAPLASIPTPSPTPSPTPAPIVFPTTYTVSAGETVWAIAERTYGSSDFVDLICYANDLSFYDPLIHSGQVLQLLDPSTAIPAPTPAPAAAVRSGGAAGYSEEEIDLYLRIVASECGSGWSYEGCLMVSQVIVNRVLCGRWGGLYNVLTAPRQFTPYNSGYYLSVTPTATQYEAAMDALNGATAFGRDVLYFCTDAAYNRSAWFQNMPIAATYANTLFFAP